MLNNTLYIIALRFIVRIRSTFRVFKSYNAINLE